MFGHSPVLRKLFAFCLLAVVGLNGCSREPDEVVLRRAVAEMQAAIEGGKVGAFVDHLSADFSGQNGSVDQRQLRALLVGQALRHEHIGVTLGPITVKLFDRRATLSLEVLATGGAWLPESGQSFHIESSWRQVDGAWQCFAAQWTERW
jgi:hypothetical protein